MSIKQTTIIATLGLGVLCGGGGCAPSAADRKMIITELKAFEATRTDRTTSDLEKVKITVFFDTAEVRYHFSYVTGQLIGQPAQMNFKKIDGKWQIVSETQIYHIWPYRKLKTTPIDSLRQETKKPL